MSRISLSTAVCLSMLGLVSFEATAQMTIDHSPAGKAKRILERISSSKIPGDHQLLQPITTAVASGNLEEAATLALTHPGFLNVTVKNLAGQISTREETLLTPLNDFSATFIGVVRDDLDARQLLTGNFVYQADPTKIPAGITVRSNVTTDIAQSNNHYQDLDRPDIDLGVVLRQVSPQPLFSNVTRTVVANPDPAGLVTTRTFLAAHASAGTNRRPVEYMFREFLCTPLAGVADVTASDGRVGRDVSRSPGGITDTYLTSCKGCHTQHDSMRGAFARWDFINNTPANSVVEGANANGFRNGIATKMNINQNEFQYGFTTADSTWVNNTTGALNMSMIGWRGEYQSGDGVKSLATAFANSKRFSQCMVKRVFESVCAVGLDITKNINFVGDMANRFESSNYNFKKLFSAVAASKECGL